MVRTFGGKEIDDCRGKTHSRMDAGRGLFYERSNRNAPARSFIAEARTLVVRGMKRAYCV
jgi:hypothetical protein